MWYEISDSDRAKILAGQEQQVKRPLITTNYPGFGDTVSVTNGTGWKNFPDSDCAYPGTYIFLTVNYPPKGMIISVH